MSTENQGGKNAPVHTHRDGSVFAKVWENQSSEGRTFHTVTLGKTYTDADGNPRETQGFNGVDLLKAQQLSQDAYRTVQHLRQAQVAQEQNSAPEQGGLQAQRNAAMSRAAPAPGNSGAEPAQQPIPKPGQTPSQ